MPGEPPLISIENPGVFILPDGEFSIASLRVLRDEKGQPDELIFVFDSKLRPKLKQQKLVQLRLRTGPRQIEIDTVGAPCYDEELPKLGLRHLHLTMLPLNLIEMVNTLIQVAGS